MLFQKWWPLRTILKYGSPLISLPERREIRKQGNREPDHPCLFIIGPPRSGSTILYQLITSLLDVCYFDNLANLARNNPYFGMWLSKRVFGGNKHQSYTSNYGGTARDGLHAPSEALFFYKWFPRDRHFTVPSDLSPAQLKAFQSTINSILNLYDKPLVIKNLTFSLRLQALKEFLPDARYVIIRREPLYTAQSVLLGMRKNSPGENKVWGIRPKDFQKLDGLAPHELVVKQVNEIERQIYNDLKAIPDENILFVDYDQLGEDLDQILHKVNLLCKLDLSEKVHMDLPDIHLQNRINLPEEEIELLKGHIKNLKWELHEN